MRNMSFALTINQIRNQSKTVTRRGGATSNGWQNLKVGDTLAACEKCMGFKKGEKILKIATIEVVSLRWDRLDAMLTDKEYGKAEVIREGFPELTPEEFVEMYCKHNRCKPDQLVHRIEFKYL